MNSFPKWLWHTIFPRKRCAGGVIATVVELLPGTTASGGEDRCILEVFNAVGETIAVVTVPMSGVAPLQRSDVLSVRSFQLS